MGMRFKMDREEEILICKLPVVPSQRTKDMDDITAFSGALSYVSYPSSYYKWLLEPWHSESDQEVQ